MLARAREATADGGIRYVKADLEALTLPQEGFDLAYSSLAFHYVSDFASLARCIHRALVPGGRLVFTIEPFLSQGGVWAEDGNNDDRWTLYSEPRALTVQFEHTLVVTRNGPLILTLAD